MMAMSLGMYPASEITCDPAEPSTCLYRPETLYQTTLHTRDVTYTTPDGVSRTFQIAIRTPKGADGLRPIVIWSHGGSDGKSNAEASGPEWGKTFARAGYVAVNIAHVKRPPEQMQSLCTRFGYTTAEACKVSMRSVLHDRPFDIKATMDYLESSDAPAALQAVMDLERVAIAGHSAGSGGTMQVAGAPRLINNILVDAADARPEAFLLLSPQGPGAKYSSTFPDSAWTNFYRPVFNATGDGDDTESTESEDRIKPYKRMPDGNKFMLFIDHPSAKHSTFGLNPDACKRTGSDALCGNMVRWVRSSAVAFLDAQLRALPEATDWLNSESIVAASSGMVEWRRK